MAMNALQYARRRSAAQAPTGYNRAGLSEQLPPWTTVGPLVRFSLPERRTRGDGILAAKFVGLE
jgi:hypothetical protein